MNKQASSQTTTSSFPKTFQVAFSRPFGTLCSTPYVFKFHGDSREQVLEWVATTFPGIDIEPTLRRWADTEKTKNLGEALRTPFNQDRYSVPVQVYDVDLHRKRIVRRGRESIIEILPEGHYRVSEGEVAEDLYKIFCHLENNRRQFERSFAFSVKCYEEDSSPSDWKYQQLKLLQAALTKATAWQANVWMNYHALVMCANTKIKLPARRSCDLPDVVPTWGTHHA